ERKTDPVKAPCVIPHGRVSHGGEGTLDLRLRSQALVQRVEATQPGERNKLLNWAAFQFGTMIAEGVIGRTIAEKLLEGAARANKLWREDGSAQCRATNRSGLDAGIADQEKRDQQNRDGGIRHGAFTSKAKLQKPRTVQTRNRKPNGHARALMVTQAERRTNDA